MLRKKAGHTQASMAEALDFSVRGYQKYEQGESFPSPETITRIADLLNVSVSDLYGSTIHNPMPKDQIQKEVRDYATKQDLEKLQDSLIEKLMSKEAAGSIPLNKNEHSVRRMFQGLSDEGQDYILKRLRFALKQYPRSAKGLK